MKYFFLLCFLVLSACGTIAKPEDPSWARDEDAFGSIPPSPPEDLCIARNDVPEDDVYRVLPDENFTPKRCNVAPFTVAVRGDGLSRAIYGNAGKGRFAAGLRPETFLLTHHQESHFQADRVLANMREQITAQNLTEVMLFAHGGMVPHKNAVVSAEYMSQAMLADGIFPVFLVWNSDFPNAYINHICYINQRAEPSRFLQNITIPVRIFSDVTSGIAQLGPNYINQEERFRRSVRSDFDPLYYLPGDCGDNCPEKEEWMISAERLQLSMLKACSHPLNSISPDCTSSFDLTAFEAQATDCPDTQECDLPTVIFPPFSDHEDLNAIGEIPIQRRLQYTLWLPARAVTTLAVPGGGKGWDNMVRRTRLAVDTRAEFRGSVLDISFDPDDVIIESNYERCRDPKKYLGAGGLGLFYDRFACERAEALKVCRASPSDCHDPLGRDDLTIALVGHSMGAIVSNELLKRYGDELTPDRLIYMAAATTIREFSSATYKIFQSDNPPAFYNLVLHPLADARELQLENPAVMRGLLPQGSLLEWIDEYFEGPRSADERTLGKWANVWRAYEHLPDGSQERTLVHVFPMQQDRVGDDICQEDGSQDRCHPRYHGEFNDYSFWRPKYLGGRTAIRSNPAP